MYNHNKAQQSKNRVHISWDILYIMLKIQDIIWYHLLTLMRKGYGIRMYRSVMHIVNGGSVPLNSYTSIDEEQNKSTQYNIRFNHQQTFWI